jgi:hypothetical protein
MPPRRRDFGDGDWPVLGELSVHSCGDLPRIESTASRAPIGPAIANEAEERIDLGHIFRSEAICKRRPKIGRTTAGPGFDRAQWRALRPPAQQTGPAQRPVDDQPRQQ